MSRILAVAGLLLLPIGGAVADSTADTGNLQAQVLALTNGRLERLVEQMQYVFSTIDRNSDGLAREEIISARTADNARERAELLSTAVREVAQYDLDGDGIASGAEIESAVRYNSSRNQIRPGNSIEAENRIKQIVDRTVADFLARYDFNADGKVALDEVTSASSDKLRRKSTDTRRAETYITVAEALMPFDADRNGRVSQLEAMAAITKAFENYKLECPLSCSAN